MPTKEDDANDSDRDLECEVYRSWVFDPVGTACGEESADTESGHEAREDYACSPEGVPKSEACLIEPKDFKYEGSRAGGHSGDGIRPRRSSERFG